MKKLLAIICVIILCFSLFGCSAEKDSGEATKIRFSQSVDELKKYDGQTVSINGFMSLLSPLNETLIYVLNLPFQACPFCEPNTSTLSNTIAVKSENIEFTTMPINVTGKLVFGNYSDAYGYEYSYRIEDAKITVLDESEISEKAKVYYTVAKEDYLADIFTVIDCVYQVAYHEQYGINPEDFKEYGAIPFPLYEDAKKTAESLNSSGDYDKFLALLNSAHELCDSVNKDLEANNIEAYKSYQPKVEELNDKFNEFINEYEF